MTMTTTTAPALDEYLLTHAFDGISWNPDNWQANTRREYAARLAEFDEKSAELENADALRLQFAQGLTARYNEWLSAMSRCMSWAIAGPARFPVRKAEAANKRERAANRLRIYYPDKPDAETRTRLKRAGFRWAPSVGAWQNYLNRQAENFVTSEFA